ncbi:Bro-N domain-containing protein [archaeon]|nr:Bro-N domain-containing protein [archaeon]
MEEKNSLAVFQDKKIRNIWFNEEWWFSLEDVVFALTDSRDPKQYIQKMKQRDNSLDKGWVQIVRTLLMQTFGGAQSVNCINTEGAFRIIQSIPSPKAEPFKLWLAKEGGEVAGNAREDLEKRSGKKVVTRENYLAQPEKTKRLEAKK